MYMDINERLFEFIEKSPTPFHAVANARAKLEEKGYSKLNEAEKWELKKGGRYYVTRNGSSIIAFSIPFNDDYSFNIVASHCDSPTFKIKENPIIRQSGYVVLNTEGYGGAILSTWMDRPLSVAGRVVMRYGEDYSWKLVNIDKDLMIIPNLAIHMDRNVNDGKSFDLQADMLPVFGLEVAGGDEDEEPDLLTLIANAEGLNRSAIVDYDLFLYNRQKGTTLGANGEFIASPKLDDLQCAYSSLEGFLEADNADACPVLAIFDNEEVGSATQQGANSTFLQETLYRIVSGLGEGEADYMRRVANSFMISADNAHALHPNKAGSYADPTNRPKINGGIVIKYNASGRYTSDGLSRGVFKGLVEDLSLKTQTFLNRSDLRGGGTLGNISNTKVSLATVDVGLPQLAMHSSYETAGSKDTEDFANICRRFFSTKFMRNDEGGFRLDKAARAHKPGNGGARNLSKRTSRFTK
ncbi:MAG: M18 family aminopeptidase [Oscillospiraceae bacterium]|nr:M18 family aminopeptidase [Oscillospiraceae bacterium]